MKKHSFILPILAGAFFLVSCSEIPKEAYFTHGQPETLLVHSKQEESFDITGKDSVKRILQWASQAKPSQASLHCKETNKFCNKIEKVMERNGISTTRVASHSNHVTFTYDKIAARDCENRYVDNMINPYNLNHPAYGCSMAVNMAQMVTDRREFDEPDLVDDMDARKAVQAVDVYTTASKPSTSFETLSSSQSVSITPGGR